MSDEVYGLTASQHRNFLEMERRLLRGPRGPGETTGLADVRDEPKPPIVATLLDALNSGQTVIGSVLNRKSLNSIQTITAFGVPSGGYFKVGLRTSLSATLQWTPNFYPMVDSPEVLQRYLTSMNGVGIGNLEVTMGERTTLPDNVMHRLWRWEVVFCGVFTGVSMPMLQIESHITGGALLVQATNPLEEIGQYEEIFCPVPVSYPTPLKAGAICMASWIQGMGYCIHACEVRDYGDYGLFS